MAQHDRAKMKGRRESGAFFALPLSVLNSPNGRALSLKAKALLYDLGASYRHGHNGDTAITWSMLKARGWASKQTLERARDELLHFGMIEQTRQGGLGIGPNLYAFTWLAIDECGGKLDVPKTAAPSGRWRMPPPAIAA